MQEFALLLGIIIAEWVNLYPRLSDSAGYSWLAIKDASLFLLPALVARWVIGRALLQLSLLRDSEFFHSWIWAALVGLIAVLLPSAFERILDKVAPAKFITGSLVQILLRFNILTGQTVRRSVQKLKEQDNFDCQHSKGWWNIGLQEKQINRRLRMLYEEFKLEISCSRQEPELLRHDVDISPGQKFYLLVAHLGRNRLRRVLEEKPPSPPPGQDWDGTERRRTIGSKSDRKLPDPNSLHIRPYDSEELRTKILKGEAIGIPPRE